MSSRSQRRRDRREGENLFGVPPAALFVVARVMAEMDRTRCGGCGDRLEPGVDIALDAMTDESRTVLTFRALCDPCVEVCGRSADGQVYVADEVGLPN